MRVRVKNNSPAPQGVSTLEGTKWIKSGATQTIEVEYSADGVPVGDLAAPPASLLGKAKDLAADAQLVDELDAALDAKPVVSMALKKPELLAIAKEEGVEFETDDNKADLIRKINAARK